MMRALLSLLLLFIISSCHQQGATHAAPPKIVYNDTVRQHPRDSVSITWGTFFGMCEGYCASEYRFHSWGIEKFNPASPLDSLKYPSQYLVFPIQKPVYDSMVSAVNIEAFSKLPERIGCPDCADGGAEWIRVECGAFKKEIDFEYGDSIPGVMNLLHLVRRYQNL